MPTIELALGSVDYREFGPAQRAAPVALFVHGFLVNGTLWERVAKKLAAAGVRCVVPDWPPRITPHPGLPGGRPLPPGSKRRHPRASRGAGPAGRRAGGQRHRRRALCQLACFKAIPVG